MAPLVLHFRNIAAVEDFIHLFLETLLDLLLVAGREIFFCRPKKVIVEIEFFQNHFRVKDVFLIDIDIDHLVHLANVVGDKILDRVDLVVNEVLFSVDVACEATHAVVAHDDVWTERVQKIIERLQRRNLTAGRDVDIGAESADAVIGVTLGVGVNGNVALIEVGDHRFGFGTGYLAFCVKDVAFFNLDVVLRHQHRDRGALGVVVLRSDIENVCADDFGNVRENFCQALGVVDLVDILDIGALVFGAGGITDVVHIETERFGQVIEAIELQFLLEGLNFHGGFRRVGREKQGVNP